MNSVESGDSLQIEQLTNTQQITNKLLNSNRDAIDFLPITDVTGQRKQIFIEKFQWCLLQHMIDSTASIYVSQCQIGFAIIAFA